MKGTVTPSELYSHMGECLKKVHWGRESITVQKRGRPIAKLVYATEVPPGKDGKRRYTSPEYQRATPGQFRSKMTDYLDMVRFGNRRVLITYHGNVVAIVKPIQ